MEQHPMSHLRREAVSGCGKETVSGAHLEGQKSRETVSIFLLMYIYNSNHLLRS